MKLSISSLLLPLILFAIACKANAQGGLCYAGVCSLNPRLDPTQLLHKFPALDVDNNAFEEDDDDYNQIMCPMMRLLRRSGILPQSWSHPHYTLTSIVNAMTTNFGFGVVNKAAMLGLAKGISAGQVATLSTFPGFVNLNQLHRVVGISHASGYSFDGNSTKVSRDILNNTMASLRDLEDEQGHLTFENLQLVKMIIAADRGVRITIPSGLETGFIWSICGGDIRGFVETTDVERFLTGRLPYTIAEPDFLTWDW